MDEVVVPISTQEEGDKLNSLAEAIGELIKKSFDKNVEGEMICATLLFAGISLAWHGKLSKEDLKERFNHFVEQTYALEKA